MHHTLDRIAGDFTDYKKCDSCGDINWYENEVCVNSDCTDDEDFTDLTEASADAFATSYAESFRNDDEAADWSNIEVYV